jgi:hypothetical protein
MNFTPQVETAEMSDADLDNVSGGMAGGGSGGLFLEVPPLGVGADAFAFLSTEGVAAGADLQIAAH